MALNPQTSAQSYQPMLQESILHFLSQLQAGVSNFSHLNLIFSRLIQTMPCPPIELTWFYAAVNYHAHKNMISRDPKFDNIVAIKELFQVLTSSAGPCSSSLFRVAVLAPLVYELHNLAVEMKLQCGLNLYDVNVVDNEIRWLVDKLVNYISLCCCKGGDDHDDSPAFSPCFVDLIKVWTVQRRGKEFEFEDDFRIFFPLISDVGRKELWLCGRVSVLAGFVMCQVLLLNLCLKFGAEQRSQKLEEEVWNSAVDTITGFRSSYFFDVILKMLQESNLPVTSLLTANDEVLLREWLGQLRSGTSTRIDNQLSLLPGKAMLFKSEVACELSFSEADRNKVFCFVQNAGEDDGVHQNLEMTEPATVAESPCKFNLADTEACRKRKGEKDEDSIRVKRLLKCHLDDSPFNNFLPFQTKLA